MREMREVLGYSIRVNYERNFQEEFPKITKYSPPSPRIVAFVVVVIVVEVCSGVRWPRECGFRSRRRRRLAAINHVACRPRAAAASDRRRRHLHGLRSRRQRVAWRLRRRYCRRHRHRGWVADPLTLKLSKCY